jgi:hypothetical protein
MTLSIENQKLLDELMNAHVNHLDGIEQFTVFYQTEFGSQIGAAYHAADGESVAVKLDDYTQVAKVNCDNLEEVYFRMQGDIWSPRGEARPIIKELGIHHTSMSVGDLIKDSRNRYWITAPIGFFQVIAL